MRLKTILGVSESVNANETFECIPDDKEKANIQNNGSDPMTEAEQVKDSPRAYAQNVGFGKSVSAAAQSAHQSESIEVSIIIQCFADYLTKMKRNLSVWIRVKKRKTEKSSGRCKRYFHYEVYHFEKSIDIH